MKEIIFIILLQTLSLFTYIIIDNLKSYIRELKREIKRLEKELKKEVE